MSPLIDYTRYLEDYKKNIHVDCFAYIQVFINFASTSNTPISELQDLHERYKHQIGRNYSKNYRQRCRRECEKFIKYLEQKQLKFDKINNNPSKSHKRRKISIHNTIKGVKKT